MQSYNPQGARSLSLGSSLFARHYLGNHSIIFFSSGYLDVSVLRVGSHCWVIYLQYIRLSHSEIFGLMFVCNYPKLIAAYHVLHRLLVPRHPPYALIRFKYYAVFIQLTRLCSRSCSFLSHFTFHLSVIVAIDNKNITFPICQRTSDQFHNLTMRQFATDRCWCFGCEPTGLFATPLFSILPFPTLRSFIHFNCLHSLKSGGYRSRTDDPLRARQVL